MFVEPDIEVNYTADVGQTLLNWASAFGTQEMVFIMLILCIDVCSFEFKVHLSLSTVQYNIRLIGTVAHAPKHTRQ